MIARQLALAHSEALLGQHDDGTTLRGLVREGGELGGVGHLLLGVATHREEVRSHAVAEGYRPGLVEQKRLDVACGFHCPPTHGQHVALDEAVHAGDADGRQKSPDGRRDEARPTVPRE